MALIAARHLSGRGDLVRIRQRKSRIGVIESGIRPQDRVVTLRTQRSWETRRDVIGYVPAEGGCAVPGCLMAAVAIGVCGGEVVIVIYMAVRAHVYFACRRQLMRTKQWPTRGRVVEHHVGPQRGVVAVRAIGRCKGRARRGVRRVIGLLPGCQVA